TGTLPRRSVTDSGIPDLPTCCSSMAVASQAAWISPAPTPASAIASSKASSIRSSASQSQRSPKREQPMPRMTTLSRMPVAIKSSSARRGRRCLPEIACEAANAIQVLDPEHHAHGHADLDLPRIDIGEVHHQTAALAELDHAEMLGRIRAVGEHVGGKGHDFGRLLGEGMVHL